MKLTQRQQRRFGGNLISWGVGTATAALLSVGFRWPHGDEAGSSVLFAVVLITVGTGLIENARNHE